VTFRVELVFQGLRRAARDERFLSGRRDRNMLVREVMLRCAEAPVVFAHSVIGPRYLRGVWRGVVTLGARSLGAALFADPRVIRQPLRFRKLAPGGEVHARACAAFGTRLPALWARRSLFVRRNAAMLVTEVYLPGMPGPG